MPQHARRGSALIIPVRASLSLVSHLGERALGVVEHVGFVALLAIETIRWFTLGLCTRRVRLGRHAVVSQINRLGVRSIGIASLVSAAVGVILALQLAPPLDQFGQRALVANITGVAILRELGPLIGAIVLTGFAGASITAEIGTMVVSEEIEALEAHALNPVRFLVVPRVIATFLSMTALAVIADLVALSAALLVSITALGIPYATFMDNLLQQVKTVDFVTGVVKGSLFGLLIGLIACANGLRVTGGAAGVGLATTMTVVQCIVAIVIADLIFTAIFYSLGLF
ncbi:MAG: MlaE family ABC transporter permease [Phycisphaerales bacterium JB037]